MFLNGWRNNSALIFLEIREVLKFHAKQVALHGGEYGIRDMGLLESAVAQAKSTFGGEFLHADVFEMSAA